MPRCSGQSGWAARVKLSVVFQIGWVCRRFISVDSGVCRHRRLPSVNKPLQLLPVEKGGTCYHTRMTFLQQRNAKKSFPNLKKTLSPCSCSCTSVMSERRGVWARLLDTIPAPGILIDFAQVDVPFVPVDFLHSETTRGHMLQLLSAVWRINQLSEKAN